MPTIEQCKTMIFNCAIKCGVSPRLIAERLLSDEDKTDMLEGNLKISSLEKSVEVWKENGMPNYRSSKFTPYEVEKWSNG